MQKRQQMPRQHLAGGPAQRPVWRRLHQGVGHLLVKPFVDQLVEQHYRAVLRPGPQRAAA